MGKARLRFKSAFRLLETLLLTLAQCYTHNSLVSAASSDCQLSEGRSRLGETGKSRKDYKQVGEHGEGFAGREGRGVK